MTSKKKKKKKIIAIIVLKKKNHSNYCITTQKLPVLKQGIKTINTEFIQTHTLSRLSLI